MNVLYFGWFLLIPLAWLLRINKRLNENIIELRIKESQIETMLVEHSKSYEEKLLLLNETKEKIGDIFKGYSLDAMEKFHQLSQTESNKRDLDFVKAISPIKDSLSKLDDGMRFIEKERKGESESFKEQIRSILVSEKELKIETANLTKALRKPDVRGVWGELQLKRVVELSGMLNYCDFYEQKVECGDNGCVRPDLLVRLPGGRHVIVDAKAPFEAFLEANNTDDLDKKNIKLKDHAKLLRQHISQLGKKNYWHSFQPTVEFVVLFLPAEVFFSSALQNDPTLIEFGAEHNVIIATPTTLIGLLRAVAYGWKQDTFSRHAKEIRDLGYELYKRIYDMNKHWSQVGKSLSSSVESYNKAIGSFENRVLVSARKFKALGATNDEIELDRIDFIENISRQCKIDE